MRRFLAAFLAALLIATPALAQLTTLGAGQSGPGGAPPPSAPVFNWYVSDYYASGSSSYTTGKGGNTIPSGSLLMIFSGQNGIDYAMTCPSGFTNFSWSPAYDSVNTINHQGCWKIAGGAESGVYTGTLTGSTALYSTWVLVNVTGVNATTPIDATGRTAHASSVSSVAPSITVTGANRLVFACGLVNGSGNSWSSTPSGYTSVLDANFLTTIKIACATKVFSAGATGSATYVSANAGEGDGLMIAIAP